MRTSSKLIVFNGTQLLLLKKRAIKTKYSLLGGGVKKKETPEEAVIREAIEEGDVHVDKNELRLLNIAADSKKGTTVYYYLVYNVNSFKLLEPHKFEALNWVDCELALPKMRKKDRAIIEDYIININVL